MEIASDQSRRVVKSVIAPRHLTEQQAKTLSNAINSNPELKGYPLFVGNLSSDPEAERYMKELSAAVFAGGMIEQKEAQRLESLDHGGLEIYYEEKSDAKYAYELSDALKTAGVSVLVLKASFTITTRPDGKSPLILWVGGKPPADTSAFKKSFVSGAGDCDAPAFSFERP